MLIVSVGFDGDEVQVKSGASTGSSLYGNCKARNYARYLASYRGPDAVTKPGPLTITAPPRFYEKEYYQATRVWRT